MKALIISEDEKVCNSLNETLVSSGYDTIIYKWLLKALDNIEEIRPDLIVVSSSEYPRHWKTLVQFVKSGIGGDNVQIYLYEPNPISQEDQEKARILGITGYFDKLEEFNPAKSGGSEEEHSTIVTEPEPAITNTGHFMFTHPSTKKFISGKFFDYNGKTMSCSFYDSKELQQISDNMVIEKFTFFDSKQVKLCSVKVNEIVNIVPDNPFVIVEVLEIYEHN